MSSSSGAPYGAHVDQDIDDMLREMGLDGDEAQPAPLDDFRGGRIARPDDIFIALMGVTGAGKSSFISRCCDDSAPAQVGHGLSSCTKIVNVHPYRYSATQTVYLIDTPGFDDSVRTDTQVLREIASWLSRSYTNKILLHGIIYIHRISDRRMQGSALKNLLTFKRLCGDNALKKVLLVTTMWDEVPSDVATAREEELVNKPEFWGRMIQKGSTTHRHANTTISARDIINRIVNGNRDTVTLDVQDEMVNQKQDLVDTAACREINVDINAQIATHRAAWEQEMKDSRAQIMEAIRVKDLETQKEFAEMRAEHRRQIAELQEAQERLRVSAEKLAEEHQRRHREEQANNGEMARLKRELEVARTERSELDTVASSPRNQAPSHPASEGPEDSTSESVHPPTTGRWYNKVAGEYMSRSGSSVSMAGLGLSTIEGGRLQQLPYPGIHKRFGYMDANLTLSVTDDLITSFQRYGTFKKTYPKLNQDLQDGFLNGAKFSKTLLVLGGSRYHFLRVGEPGINARVSCLLPSSLASICRKQNIAMGQIVALGLGIKKSWYVLAMKDSASVTISHQLGSNYPSLSSYLKSNKYSPKPLAFISLNPSKQDDFVFSPMDAPPERSIYMHFVGPWQAQLIYGALDRNRSVGERATSTTVTSRGT